MVSKIDIPEFGLFKNYIWNTVIGTSESFKKINIIFGRNYSDKTTLSRIFNCEEDGVLHRHYSSGSFSLAFADGSVAKQDKLACNFRVRVYNSDFVKENLSWLRNDDGSIKPFTILGAKNVELDKKIKNIGTQLGGTEERTGLYFSFAEKTASRELKQKNYDSKSGEDSKKSKSNRKDLGVKLTRSRDS